MRMLKFLFIALILALATAQSWAGQTFYISPQGSDSNNGSINAPWQNLGTAVYRVSAGDTIILRGGTHIVNEVYINGSEGMGGAPGQYLTIKAYPGETPVMQPGSRRLIIWADYVRVEGLHFIMPWRLDIFGEGHQIINNTFTGVQPKFGAIETGGSNILVEGNWIELEGGGNTQDHGMYIHKGENITVKNNTVIGSTGYGIHVFDQHKTSEAGQTLTLRNYTISGNLVMGSRERAGIIVSRIENLGPVIIENITIERNVSVNNAWQGIRVLGGTGMKVYNNTLVGNGFQQILVRDSRTEVEIKNNIMSNGDGVYVEDGGSVDLNTNLYSPELANTNVQDANPIVDDPQFVAPQANNFSLKSTSPAIDTGLEVGLPFSGSAPDIGAFEFGGFPTHVEDQAIQPDGFVLHQNYPNPFNPETKIKYEVSSPTHVTLYIYDVIGHRILTLVDEHKSTGTYTTVWNGKNKNGENVASGVYFYRLEVGGQRRLETTKRMILLR